MVKMSTIQDLQKIIIQFRDKRNWKQFHNPKDVALSLVLEAAEVLEHFQWKDRREVENYVNQHKGEIGDELADVFYWVLLLTHDLNIDISNALKRKIKKNERKYPIKKARGKHTKYTRL